MKIARGHEEVRELWGAFRSVWDEVSVEMVEVLADEDEALVAKARFRGIGSGSGIEVDRILFYAH